MFLAVKRTIICWLREYSAIITIAKIFINYFREIDTVEFINSFRNGYFLVLTINREIL